MSNTLNQMLQPKKKKVKTFKSEKGNKKKTKESYYQKN